MFLLLLTVSKVKSKVRNKTKHSDPYTPSALIVILCSQKETCSIIMQRTAVFYTTISRLHYISKYTSVSAGQNWASVLQCINQIRSNQPWSSLPMVLFDRISCLLAIYQQNMGKCWHCLLFIQLNTPTYCLIFEQCHTMEKICSCSLDSDRLIVALYSYLQQVVAGHLM